ncbi:MAG: CaiB/BaiF CoA transferase family protein [Hyphomicrobiales bacterium]
MNGALHGIRVLDLTSVLLGPYATQLLADFGADVIKVESFEGDVMRQSGPMKSPDMGHLYLTTNENKRSIAIDLKNPAAAALMHRLVAQADVLVYSIRPKAMARLGLSYETVRAINRSIVYAGAVGFSQRGPYADRPAYDDLIQGMAGVPWLVAQAGVEPRYSPVLLADRSSGLHLALAICAALVERSRSGLGQRIDVPMFETLVSMTLGEHLAGKLFDPVNGKAGYTRSLSASRRPYRTRDGYLCVMVYNDKHWRSLFDAIGRPEIPREDPRYATQAARIANIDVVYGFLNDLFETRTTDEWLQLLHRADIPAARMYSVDDLLTDEHLRAVGFFGETEHPTEGQVVSVGIPSEWSRTPPSRRSHAPALGEHSEAVLREAGLSEGEIRAALAADVIRPAGPRERS